MSDWIAVAVRFALYADLMILFGLAAFVRFALSEGERAWAFTLPLRPTVAALSLLGVALSGLALLILAAGMSGVALTEVDSASIAAVLRDTAAGTAWMARTAALAMALLLAAPSRTSWSLVSAVAGLALVTLAWSGHGAMDEGSNGWVHLAADILHLLAAAAWLGALAGFLLLLWGSRREAARLPLTHRALAGFSSAGTVLVAVIILSGLANLWFTVGLPQAGALFTTPYGQLLLAKLALFGVMLLLASLNRFRLTPRLALDIESKGSSASRRALRASVAMEAACGVVILAAVAWLGTLSSPISGM